MSKDDYFVIVFKVLSYLYKCVKEGVKPSAEKARELANCNDVYWEMIFRNLIDDGYIKADVMSVWSGKQLVQNLCITTKGVEFLENNSTMHSVKDFLGTAFETVVYAAIKATAAY